METIHRIIIEINQSLSDYVLLFLLLGAGLWFSFKTRFVQLRYFKDGIKRLFSGFSGKKEKQKNGMSSFQALATAIAAQVGTGNIVGASGAILTGGPGAILWMWIIAFLGMATIYAEAVLAQKTRVKSAKGDILGGPVYYIMAAFKGKAGKLLAGFFAAAGVIAMGFLGAMVQANSIAETIQSAFGLPPWAVGILLVLLCGLIVMGGTRRLAGVMETFVPVMAGIFLLGALAVLLMNITKLPTAIGLIFKYAFSPQAIIGGSFGAALKTALSQGAKRGLFSNEAGMGTTPHAHAQAMVDNPHQQGTVAIIGVFIDTFVVLTLNALVIITTLYTPGGPLAEGHIPEGISSTNLCQTAFSTAFGESFGPIFVAICLFFFAFSTILGWNLFGKINSCYLFGEKSIVLYQILALSFVFLGSISGSGLVWDLLDLFNQLIVLPNVLALFALTGSVGMILKTYGK